MGGVIYGWADDGGGVLLGEPTGASAAGCVALAGEMERCCEGNYEGYGRYACGGGDCPVGLRWIIRCIIELVWE